MLDEYASFSVEYLLDICNMGYYNQFIPLQTEKQESTCQVWTHFSSEQTEMFPDQEHRQPSMGKRPIKPYMTLSVHTLSALMKEAHSVRMRITLFVICVPLTKFSQLIITRN